MDATAAVGPGCGAADTECRGRPYHVIRLGYSPVTQALTLHPKILHEDLPHDGSGADIQ